MSPSNIYWHRDPEVMKYRASATFVKRAYIFNSKVNENFPTYSIYPGRLVFNDVTCIEYMYIINL